MAQKTALNEMHREAGGKMVDFAGFELPLHYGSQLREHHAVRNGAGMFDVSHMAIFDLAGRDTWGFLRRLLANAVDRLAGPGRALYTCILNPDGGVLDDALLLWSTADAFRLVSNAATRAKIGAWLQAQGAEFGVDRVLRDDLAMLAVQGPAAREAVEACLPVPLRPLAASLPRFGVLMQDDWCVTRTGYTGEDGYEISLPAAEAPALWQTLAAAGAMPCGLGSRDTLRLEAGLCLYGQDLDERVTPLESGLAWTVAFEPEDRQFIGRPALEAQRQTGGLRRFVGLVLEEPGILRHGQRVAVPGCGEGQVSSGGYSPTLDRSVGFARLPPGDYSECLVDIRGRNCRARVTSTRFLAGRR